VNGNTEDATEPGLLQHSPSKLTTISCVLPAFLVPLHLPYSRSPQERPHSLCVVSLYHCCLRASAACPSRRSGRCHPLIGLSLQPLRRTHRQTRFPTLCPRTTTTSASPLLSSNGTIPLLILWISPLPMQAMPSLRAPAKMDCRSCSSDRPC